MSFTRGTILVVEDDEAIAGVLERGLVLAGYGVRVAPDGETARAFLAATPLAAVVLDVMLPDTDGISLCARIRAEPSAPPVLLLTARDDPEVRASGMTAGAEEVMLKPFVYAELLAALDRLTRRR